MESSDRSSPISVQQADENDVAVHVIGAGPVGLLLTALLQSMEGFSVRLIEEAARVHANAHGPACTVPRGGFGRELRIRCHRRRQHRGNLRSTGARPGTRVQTVHPSGS